MNKFKNYYLKTGKIKNFYTNIYKNNFNNNPQIELKNYIGKKDHMISGFFKDGSARYVISDISDTLKDVKRRFDIQDNKKLSQLGIAFNTSLTLNSFLNGEERVKLVCQYYNKMYENKSMMTTIYSESIGTGEVRGFIEEIKVDKDENKDDKEEYSSFLKISKILYNHSSEVYGIIKLRNSNRLTEEDIFTYFEESEQIRTHVHFNFQNKNDDIISQSFILQKMPGCDDVELEKRFEKIINNRYYKDIEQYGLSYTKLNKIFDDLKIKVEMTRTPIQFYCRCSKELFKKSLVMLDKDEILDMKDKNQNSIVCKTCNTEYILDQYDFEELLSKIKNIN
jgi:molecular chaperone Hsp33